MPIVIAHGQPKSGSTFLYVTALEIAALANGEEYYRFRTARLGKDFQDFRPSIEPELIHEVSGMIDPKDYIILKTHNVLTPDIEELIDNGSVLAFTSFRDPRDTVLSTLDAGKSDRERGSTRWFTKFTEAEQLVAPVRRQFERVVPWIQNRNVLAIPYYMIAYEQAATVTILARHLGCGAICHHLASAMDVKKSSLPEWNKGLADRYIDILDRKDVQFLNQAFAKVLPVYDRFLRDRMGNHNYNLLCAHLIAEREGRLQSKLEGLEA